MNIMSSNTLQNGIASSATHFFETENIAALSVVPYRQFQVNAALHNVSSWGICVLNAFMNFHAISDVADHLWRDLTNEHFALKQTMCDFMRKLRMEKEITLEEQVATYRVIEKYGIDLGIAKGLCRQEGHCEELYYLKFLTFFQGLSSPASMQSPLSFVPRFESKQFDTSSESNYTSICTEDHTLPNGSTVQVAKLNTKHPSNSDLLIIKKSLSALNTGDSSSLILPIGIHRKIEDNVQELISNLSIDPIAYHDQLLQNGRYLDVVIMRAEGNTEIDLDLSRSMNLLFQNQQRKEQLCLSLKAVLLGQMYQSSHVFVYERVRLPEDKEIWIEHNDEYVGPMTEQMQKIYAVTYSVSSLEELIIKDGLVFRYVVTS